MVSEFTYYLIIFLNKKVNVIILTGSLDFTYFVTLDMNSYQSISIDSHKGETDIAAREARKKKIKELEASLFGDTNPGDAIWNQKYAYIGLNDLTILKLDMAY